MSTIYEDVALLKEQMAQVQADIASLSGNIPDVNDLLSKATTNITNEDLDDWIGEIFVGYGNDCTNKPAGAGNGYFINIPHSLQQYKSSYNKQYWIERTNNRVWTRMQENSEFSDWVMIGGKESVTGSAKITNETFNGKTVYCKTINTGSLPNTALKEIASGLTPSEITVTKITGVVYGEGDSLPIPNPHPTLANAISCYLRSDGKICIGTGKDRTALSGFVQIYYTNN
ncbi:MAG: hypothetical protein ACI4WG_05285 [Erysipelotrichaceae bacterium]